MGIVGELFPSVLARDRDDGVELLLGTNMAKISHISPNSGPGWASQVFAMFFSFFLGFPYQNFHSSFL